MKRWLVFGLSGQVGVAFLDAMAVGEAELVAVSRQSRTDAPGLQWVRAGYGEPFQVPGAVDAVISFGPLDLFTRWFEQSGMTPQRVVALGSTSVHSKSASPDPSERELAQRLATAERQLDAACRASGSHLCLLRPTLIYGGGDRSLSRVVALARRWHVVPLPADATGLRQPVHAGDLAAATLACLRADPPVQGRYDLPGGETLSYREMLHRTLAVAVPRAILVRVPGPLFRTGLRALRAFGMRGAGEGLLARFDRDLVYDAGPARRDFGYSPRPFRPEPDMFRG